MDITKICDVALAVKEKERLSGEKVSAAMKTELVARVAGKASSESQKELARALDIPIKEFEHKKVQKDESVRLEFTVTKEQYEKLMKCQDLAVHKIQQGQMGFSLASVIEVLADKFIAEKTKLSEKAEVKSYKKPKSDNKTFEKIELNAKSSTKMNQTLTPKTKIEILMRDQCCQFKDEKTGKVCGSTFAVQIDHRTPQWAGGDHSKGNLQILCAQHNRYKYRQESQLQFL